jgi:SAM-dependent methyltransferase
MKEEDIKIYIERYNQSLKKHGYSPESLGWGKNGRQDIRFGVMGRHILKYPDSSVLDVGCGFADLYRYLINNNWNGKYTGLDIVNDLLNVAKEIDPSLELINDDIISVKNLEKYDFVLASGIFNAKLSFENNYNHITNTLTAMFKYSDIAVIADFMSIYVDFQKEGAWHSDPNKIIEIVKKLSKRFIIYYDYMPYEFTIVIFKNDSISEINTFYNEK